MSIPDQTDACFLADLSKVVWRNNHGNACGDAPGRLRRIADAIDAAHKNAERKNDAELRARLHTEIERLRKDRDEWKEAAENGLVALRSIDKKCNRPAMREFSDPEPYCLVPWTWAMAQAWLQNHPEWSLHGELRAGHNQGWMCECGSLRVTESTPERAVRIAARLEKHRQNQ